MFILSVGRKLKQSPVPDNRQDSFGPCEGVVVKEDVIFGQGGIVDQEHQVASSDL